MNNKLLIFVVFIIICLTSALLIYREGSLAVSKNDNTNKIFVIAKGESLDEIIKNLASSDLIRNKIVFYVLVRQTGAEKNIQAGDFRLSPSMDAKEIINKLQHGTLDNWITVPEGLRKEEVAQIISQALKIPEVEFIKLADEGYLFPDTYLIPTDATSETIINMMKNNFEKKYAPLKNKAKILGLTDDQVVTLASLVEREAKYPEDRKVVASIMYKRLKKDMPLQIDATVQYLLGYQAHEKTWWKKDLTLDDLAIDSPYNTRKNPGLPPGPICNPGLASLEAVANADESIPYFYYVSDKASHLHFGVSLEDHNANIKKYLQ